MRVVPRTVGGKVQFYRTHVPKWAQDPQAIGSTPQEIAAMEAKLAAAVDSVKRQKLAVATARAATMAMHEAVEELANAGAAVIGRVRSTARMEGKSVYTAALISPPKKGSRLGPPGQPSEFKFAIDQLGTLTLKWKCRNPRGAQGTMYEVYRRLGSSGPHEFLATTGKKRFVDQTLPQGVSVALYKIVAVRSTRRGASAEQYIQFGSQGPAVPETKPTRIAA